VSGHIEARHTPSYGTAPHLPAPLSAPVAATAAKPLAPWPIRVGISAQTHRGLLDYTNGKRGRPTMDAVRRFVMACVDAANGKKSVAVNASAATMVLTPSLRATLASMHGYEWSDAAVSIVFDRLNELLH
jgi:hypothetical protein